MNGETWCAASSRRSQPWTKRSIRRHWNDNQTDPLERELDAPYRLDTLDDALRLLLLIGIGLPAGWKSIRRISSGCLCSNADEQRWNGRSKQNQRSVRNVAAATPCIFTSAIQEPVMEHWPLRTPSRPSSAPGCRAVAGDSDKSARTACMGRRGLDGERRVVVALLHSGDAFAPAQVDAVARQGLELEVLGVVLPGVDEGGPACPASLKQQVESR
ncbi:MAG: hypothetical protein IPO58_01920 [Betaproteobacteria bacterium]|nr:hypothetical protein [Betaproteobacteria bacterium]